MIGKPASRVARCLLMGSCWMLVETDMMHDGHPFKYFETAMRRCEGSLWSNIPELGKRATTKS